MRSRAWQRPLAIGGVAIAWLSGPQLAQAATSQTGWLPKAAVLPETEANAASSATSASAAAAVSSPSSGASVPDPSASRPADGRMLAAASDTLVEQPRSFGHTMGDVLTQRVLLQRRGRDFTPATLPAPSRLGVWFERRSPRMAIDPDGRRWLIVDYQLVNSPQTPTTVYLPAWQLAGEKGEPPLRIAAWPVGISPIAAREAEGPAGGSELMPDRPAPLVRTSPLQRRLLASSFALLLCLGTWAMWFGWRSWQSSRSQPFAVALRALRRHGNASPESWVAMHRAFDRSAGQALHASTLPALFERAPHLSPQRAGIEGFYARSAERFFGSGIAGDEPPLRDLCSQLRRLERRHER